MVLSRLKRILSPMPVPDQIDALMRHERPLSVLDVGCGISSQLSVFRSAELTLAGLDISQDVVEAGRSSGVFDTYYCGDFRTLELPQYDAVVMFDMIEHFEKDEGLLVLKRAESLAQKFVVVMTPTGFVPQGPEYGNEFQRHLSGWFPEDFEGRGYKVEGAARFRPLYSYGAGPRFAFRGLWLVNALMFRCCRAQSNPRRAFHMIAVKDMRGVPERWTQSTRAG